MPPDIGGPRVRLGALWFFLALAAVTAGRWWTAMLLALMAGAGGFQLCRAWRRALSEHETTDGGDEQPRHVEGDPHEDPTDAGPPDDVDAQLTEHEPDASEEEPVVEATGTAAPWQDVVPAPLAAMLAVSIVLAAGWGSGLAGAMLIVAALVALSWSRLEDLSTGYTIAISALLPGIAAASVVLALLTELWAALFLVLAVSLFDAGSFLLGAESRGRWEGPIGGIVGVLAVTFTVSTIGFDPFTRIEWWLVGVLVAVACLAGQGIVSYQLPTPTTWVPAMRRLDAYLVAGPVVVACAWLFGS